MWKHILLRIFPFDVYREIRGDMTDIYVTAYRELPTAQAKFRSLSNPELRELAQRQAVAAKNYDPAEPIREVKGIVDGLWKVVKTVLLLLFAIGAVSGSGYLVILSRGLLQTLSEVNSIFVSILLLAPSSVAVLVALLLIFIRLIFSSTVIIQTLNQEIVYGPEECATRDKARLVGVALWNASLNGGAAIKLLCVFSTLWLLSLIPRWNPYGYIVAVVKENIDAFDGVGGYRDATVRVYHRIRQHDDSNR
jgi:hypothetical protein